MKKIMADRDLSGTGKRPTLARTVLHYFTQKYGLKKMAEEYIFGLINGTPPPSSVHVLDTHTPTFTIQVSTQNNLGG